MVVDPLVDLGETGADLLNSKAEEVDDHNLAGCAVEITTI
jgi:hypothetical protein